MEENTIRFVRCERCNLSMRVRVQKANPDAMLMRYAESGKGLCASCAATMFLHSVEHIKKTIDEKREMLLWPAMQQQFTVLMAAGQADAKPEEINWQAVHDNWELPFSSAKRARKR
jgi:hypothetical protein